MKVVTTKMLFRNGSRIRPGTVLEVPDDTKPADWFEPVKAAKPQKLERPKPTTMSEVAKAQTKGPLDIV